jgi:hypothetical protein
MPSPGVGGTARVYMSPLTHYLIHISVKITQNEATTTVGTKLPVLQHAVGILQQGLNEDTSEIPAQERKTDFAAQSIGYEDDDDE